MRTYMKYLCAVLMIICASAHAWAAANIAEGRYDLVTDVSTLNTSDSYIIAGSKSGLWAMQPYSSGNNCSCVKVLNSFVTGTPEESITLDGSEGVAEFTLSGSASGWSIFDGQNYYYTDGAATSGQNYLKGSDNGSVANHLWTITSPGGGSSPGQVYVHNTTNTNVPYMHLSDNSTPQMACYNGSGKVYIYKKIPTVTLHDGVGGASTSTIAIGAYFPNDAAEVPGWAFIGYWATSADQNCQPNYPSGPDYNAGDQAAAGTYYAIYQGQAYGCNYGIYSCKPTAIYVLSQTNPSSGVGVNLVVPDIGCGEVGTTITLTLVINEPGTSYQGATIVRDDNGQAVSFTYDDSGADPIITFDLPASDVTATVNFECPDVSGETVTIPTITPVYNTSTSKWEATAAWNAVDGATHYNVQLGNRTTTTVLTSPNPTVVTTTSYTNDAVLKNLTVDNEYRLMVQAYNSCDAENPTAYSHQDFTPHCAELEGTLAIALDEVGSTTANLSWGGATTSAIQTTAGANSSLKYDVQITRILPLPAESTGGTLDASDVTYTSWEGTGLTTGATYQIDVTAKNACGETMAASRTFKCKAYEDYLFTCADLSLTDEEALVPKTPIWITTSAGQLVRSQKALHIEGSGLAPNAAFTFTIGGVAANDCSGTGAHDLFAIRQADYSAVTANASGAIDMDVYVFYNPTATTDGLDQPGSTIEATSAAGKVGDREYKSMSATLSTTSVNGRHLPSQFVIAARVGKTWYALPANITTNATQDPVMIGVNNSTDPTVAYCPTTYGFRLVSLASTEAKQSGGTADNGGFAANGEKVKLGLQNNLPMFGSTTTTLGNGGSATSLWGGGSTYWWTLEHKNAYATNINAVTYNIRTANTNVNPLIRLSRGQWKWGLYNGGVEEIRLLGISPVEELTLEAMEWSTNELAVSYTGGGTLTKVQIGDAEEGSATMSSIGGDIQRISGLNSMVAGASGKQCQQMLIQITESGVLKQKILQVPFIVNSTDITTTNLRDWTGGSSANEKDSISWNMEIVVRPGAKLTTDANTGKFGALSVYPGGAVEISNVIRLARFTMRGGYSWLGSAFAMPHAKVTANVSGTGNKVVYDYYIDDTQYYDLALPKTMTWVPVTDDKGSEDFVYWVKQYDGATRAATGSGWAWYDWSGDPSSWSINAGQGYLLAATPKYGRPYLVMRFPMNMTLATDESTKAPISVTAHGMTAGALNPGVSANNAGWNLIANPFMTSYMKDADGYAGDASLSGSIQVGELVPEIKDGKETGKYEWDATGGKNVRYVTTYSYATGEYKQHPMSSTVLEPFTGFFIQVAKDCSVKFDASGRQNNIIRRLRAGLPDDMEVGITVRFGDETDETILLLCDELSREDALEFPDENSKVMNAGHLNFYTFAGMTTMYANGMTYAEGQEWNAAGLTAIKDGEYTFSVSKVNTDYIKAVMLKDIYNNAEYDLLMSDVTLYLDKGTVDDRFALKIVLKSEQDTPTALDEIMEDGSSEGPKKYIYNNVMYIRHNNRIYDSTGRKILETNK